MQENWTTKLADNIVLALVYGFWAIIFLGGAFTVYEWLYTEPIPEKVTAVPSNCQLTQVMPVEGGAIVESSPGEYRYEVYMTTKGVEVYKCK